MSTPILQFGTSRFLQAHVDLFVDEALERGEALGRIAVVQTTGNAQSLRRIAALAAPGGYPVRIRGRAAGQVVDDERRVTAIAAGYDAATDWAAIRTLVESTVQVIVSNTGDRGYELSAGDGPHLIEGDTPPRSFPAKLLVLLHWRWRHGGAPITLYPCELVAHNGSVLREVVARLARAWRLDEAFTGWLGSRCIWVDSLVDRIVSEALEPAGAVAEPYALWAIEAQPGMVLPCRHPRVVVTDRLATYERRKLYLLNAAHTFLAERWLAEDRAADETVAQAMGDPALRGELEALWEGEILPVFDGLGEGAEARAYVADVRERFINPFLAHRLADIAQNHAEKKRRRLLPLVTLASELELGLPQPRLYAALHMEAA
ncbi:mannitol dehydrogenase family protein [Pseudoduganella sp. SL102]|uniref:mannitol dehydrogenase family protein n=1 Tax=Pseudoduganella sp. SL102 TaxID=2995154 RepID=UPI00248B9D25|nr:mannitol dehydrogenase family protein [Pseudoduganella sp. SL102]WBS05265.1 mannitol dehydrogenase family protein [Pseudoduganella sp. SL102]